MSTNVVEIVHIMYYAILIIRSDTIEFSVENNFARYLMTTVAQW